MAGQNDFLVFGTDPAAHVMPQADYLAAVWRLLGFDTGIAIKEQLNKVWRQSSVMSSALAQFIANTTNLDVLDNGNAATVTTNLGKAIAIAAALSGSAYVVAGGTANALTATLSNAPIAYTTGMFLQIKATAANTGAATLNVSALGAKNIIQPNGSALVARQITTGAILLLVYDGTNFILFNSPDTLDGSRYAVAGGTGNALTATITAPMGAYGVGQEIKIKATAVNSGAATINVNSLGIRSIVNYDGSALIAGEIQIGTVLVLVDDGTNYVFANAPYGPTGTAGANDQRFATHAFVSGAVTSSLTYKYVSATSAAPLIPFSFYEVDTRSGAVSLVLPATPAQGSTLVFADAFYTWGTNILTLQRNGQTIEGQAADLTASTDGIQFSLIFNGTTWKLQ